MQFIHAADLHIGATFAGIRQPNGVVAEQLLNAPDQGLAKLVSDAIANDVDFVILAGDLFATPQPDQQSLLRFRTAMIQLESAGIPVYTGTGNHDFGLAPKLRAMLPENVHIFSDQGETFTLTNQVNETVAISGFSYDQRHLSVSMLPTYPQRLDVDYHIGVYHGEQSGTSGQYAPFTVPDMLALQYDYWALGHIHQRQLLHERPYVTYSGNLQGYHEKETGAKGYQLVDDVDGILTPKFIAVAPVEWVRAEIEADDPEVVAKSLRQAFMGLSKLQLVSLVLITNNHATQQQILQHAFDVNYYREADDHFHVVGIKIGQSQSTKLPTVDSAYWDASYDAVFNEDNLYELGLKTIKDPALLSIITSKEFMTGISEKSRGYIQSVAEVEHEN